MSYNRITWAPDVLRAAGLTVVEHPGWRTRGLSESRRFEPSAVVWHHDASALGDSPGVPDAMIARFDTAAAQFWVDRAGRWHIIASGRAPHAGAVLPGMPDNETSIGVETDHTTGESWPPALLSSLRRGTAALLQHMHQAASGLHFHKTICSPPGRKIDPAGLDLAAERMRVAVLFSPAVLTRGKNVDHAIGDTKADIKASATKPRRLAKLRAALDALRSIKPRRK
jgi:hypothetical protein